MLSFATVLVTALLSGVSAATITFMMNSKKDVWALHREKIEQVFSDFEAVKGVTKHLETLYDDTSISYNTASRQIDTSKMTEAWEKFQNSEVKVAHKHSGERFRLNCAFYFPEIDKMHDKYLNSVGVFLDRIRDFEAKGSKSENLMGVIDYDPNLLYLNSAKQALDACRACLRRTEEEIIRRGRSLANGPTTLTERHANWSLFSNIEKLKENARAKLGRS